MGTSWARTVGDVSPESTRKGENGNLSQTAGKTVEEMVKGQVVTYAGCVCVCVCVCVCARAHTPGSIPAGGKSRTEACTHTYNYQAII